MKKLLFGLLILTSGLVLAQQSYFQQEVNYRIKVTLDDKKHVLNAFEEFEYVNNSGKVLNEIYIHLWPNAYKNGETALAKQQYRTGDNYLMIAEDKDKGWIDSLDFKVNGKKVILTYDEKYIDVAKIELNSPLNSGDKITVTTPFRVKIPNAKISRLGHVDESYMITQWYPKPAVFDKNGWNTMPYLGQGEFYSEFGTFEVKITLPENYVIGATGDAQEKSELDFLEEKAIETKKKYEDSSYFTSDRKTRNAFPASSENFKTVTYKQSKVHDFAWFADKRFGVIASEVELPKSKRVVKTYAMFTPKNAKLWENADEYINDGTYYYSLWNGDYPYNHVTAIDGTIAAGGGMEYPNVTVIGNTSRKEDLEVVIVHEVGHNWFYGILGSNERMHAWMDEGLNTLNEVRYIQTKYPENTRLADMIGNGSFNFHGKDYHDQNDLFVRSSESLGLDQPMETHSDDFTSANYGIIVYQKTGLSFDYMKYYLGQEKFDQIMNQYYETWKFKHPQPEDMRAVFEKETGENLSWFFDEIINYANSIDYKLKSVKTNDGKTKVKVKDVGQIAGPIPVTLTDTNGQTITKWIPAYTKKAEVSFDIKKPETVVIDIENQIPEVNRTNNNWNSNNIFKKVEPLSFSPLFSYNRQEESNIHLLPALGANVYDKFMLGVTLHNFQVPLNRFSMLITPMYSFGNNSLVGIGEFIYSFKPERAIKFGKLGLSAKSFKQGRKGIKNTNQYLALSPYLNLDLGVRGPSTPHHHNVILQGLYADDLMSSSETEIGAFVQYEYKFIRPDHKIQLKLRGSNIQGLNTNVDVSRATFDLEYQFKYLKKKQDNWISLRVFAGSNLSFTAPITSNRYDIPLSGASGAQDLFFEEYYFGRNETNGMWAQQRNDDFGGFKSVSTLSTQTWLTSANLYADVPYMKRLLGVYADAGVVDMNGTTNTAFNTGFALSLAKVLKVYFPVWNNQVLENQIASAKYQERIRFSLKMNIVNSNKLLERLK